LYYALTDIFARELVDARAKSSVPAVQTAGRGQLGVIKVGQTG
jgi:hypothetical protein